MSFDINSFSRKVYDSAKKIEVSLENVPQVEKELKQSSDELKTVSGEMTADTRKNLREALEIFDQYEKSFQERAGAQIATLEPSRIVKNFHRDLNDFLKLGDRVEKSEESGGA